MKDLKDLLIHEIQDLYSAEEQIIEALPLMIKKAKDGKLLKALKDHLKVTENQKARLDEVKELLMGESVDDQSETASKKGFFGSFFGGKSNDKQVCRGMQGLIEEGQKVMGEDMSPEVLDAAIIACAQKIEHYEICGYGTARAYARELQLGVVAERLEETLDEEYEADDLLTDIAVGGLNEEAETGNIRNSLRSRKGGSRSKVNAKQNGTATSATSKNRSGTSGSAPKGISQTKKSGSSARSRAKSAPAKGKPGSSTRARSTPAKGKSGSSGKSKSRGK